MSSGGRQDPPGQPTFSSDYLSGEGGGRFSHFKRHLHRNLIVLFVCFFGQKPKKAVVPPTV